MSEEDKDPTEGLVPLDVLAFRNRQIAAQMAAVLNPPVEPSNGEDEDDA